MLITVLAHYKMFNSHIHRVCLLTSATRRRENTHGPGELGGFFRRLIFRSLSRQRSEYNDLILNTPSLFPDSNLDWVFVSGFQCGLDSSFRIPMWTGF